MQKKLLALLLTFIFLIPFFAAAQFNVGNTPQPTNQGQAISLVETINRIINNIIWPLVIGGVIILFIMAGFKFLNAKGDPGELETARRFLIWGIIGTVIIIISFSVVLTLESLLNIN